jgi:hypothetical protein
MSGSFGEGVGDVGRSAYANVGDTYQAFLRGDMAPQATMTGTMEQTVTPGDEPAQSYTAAMLQHGSAAGQEAELDHFREVEAQSDIGPATENDPTVGSGPGAGNDPQQPDIG